MNDYTYSERQLQIINAAIKLMGSGGIQMLTTRNLAKEVGVTEPALYRHFSSVVDILQQVLEYLKSRIIQRLEGIVNAGISPSEKLSALVTQQFIAFTNRPEVVVVLLSEGLYQNNKDLSTMVFSIMKESSVYYRKVIKEGQEKGEFRDDLPAEQIAFLMMGSMRFCVIRWHLSGYSYDLQLKGKDLLKTFFTLIK